MAIDQHIEGVVVTPLRKILDERGSVMHMLRRDSEGFKQFGEIYFSTVHPGAIKAWHLHREMTLNYAVPVGKIKLAIYDERKDSPTHGNLKELFIGEDNYCLVTVPFGVYNGFKGLGNIDSVVANCSTHPHTKDEISYLDPLKSHIPYNWDLKHG